MFLSPCCPDFQNLNLLANLKKKKNVSFTLYPSFSQSFIFRTIMQLFFLVLSTLSFLVILPGVMVFLYN